MEIELRVIEGCPHVAEMLEALGAIVEDRVDIALVIRVIRTEEEASFLQFPGSPTILIDGEDPFPSDPGVTGLSCRRYALDHGGIGIPDEEMLRKVIEAHEAGIR
ncbi:MAG: thioredoxin family protein [Acidimicrobiales bacterium]